MHVMPPSLSAPVSLAELPQRLRGGTVAIGNFDGVHRGHQAVLLRAREGEGPSLALTFEPHPRAYFSQAPIFRLTTEDQKAEAIAALGLDATVVAPFDAALAALSGEAFVEEILVRALDAQHVVVGHDFHFGAKRGGNPERLQAWCASRAIGVEIVEPISDRNGSAGGETLVSSSRIRAMLAEGHVEGANAALGRRYQVRSPIIHGEKRGREMNYPTANQALAPENGLKHGIYAVRTRIGDTWHDGVASFGRRPTFDNGAPLLETFIFDFSGDLYGVDMTTSFFAFLRPELRFDGMDALIRQMDEDSRNAREILASVAPLSPLDEALNF